MERARCGYCRNPVKPHQTSVGEADQVFHEDCWPLHQQRGASGADLQQEYLRRIAEEGLAGLLSPYVSVFPAQRHAAATPSLAS